MTKTQRVMVGSCIALISLIVTSLAPAAATSTQSWDPWPFDPSSSNTRLSAYPFAPYDFLYRKRNGKPVAYNRCVAHPVRINPANADTALVAMAQDVIREVSAATGINFFYAGTTKRTFEGPFKLKGALVRPILISFETRVTATRLQGDVVGIGMSYVLTKKKYKQLAAGRLVVDMEDYHNFTQNPALAPIATDLLKATLLHEFGHVVGLAHVADPTQLMYPYQTPDNFAFASGDLAGLAVLGSQPCAPKKNKKTVKKRNGKKGNPVRRKR
jgi:hypothetical protein